MKLGPRRRIVGEELIRPDGETMSSLYEVLSCGHRRPASTDADGDYTASERCCRGCERGLPTGPPGRVFSSVSFDDPVSAPAGSRRRSPA